MIQLAQAVALVGVIHIVIHALVVQQNALLAVDARVAEPLAADVMVVQAVVALVADVMVAIQLAMVVRVAVRAVVRAVGDVQQLVPVVLVAGPLVGLHVGGVVIPIVILHVLAVPALVLPDAQDVLAELIFNYKY